MLATLRSPRRRMRLVLAGLACAALLAASPAKDVNKAGKLFQKADKALRDGRVEDAKRIFKEALEVLPDFPEAHIGLGHIAMSEKRFEDALREYRQAKGGYAQMGAVLFDIQTRRYADNQKEIQRLRDSINQLQSAGGGGGPGATAGLDIPMRVSQLENRIAQLEAIQPPNRETVGEPPAEVDFYIGNAHFRLGRVDEAIEAWEACAARNPSYGMVFNNLALGYWKTGRLDEARASLTKAVELGFPVNPRFKADLEKTAR